jgi:hypothetical protein
MVFGAPGVAQGTYEKVNGSRAHYLNLSVTGQVRGGSGNRAILAMHGSRVVVCLNGECWASADRVDVRKAGDVAFTVEGSDSHNPASVTITRFVVFRAA